MPLAPGTRIGPYEVTSALGSGGMGVVYRARDTKLGRTVAIKALPELFASDPEHVARFAREAQLLATLNHPHIGGIHGLEEDHGSRFLILEYIDGQSLAERLTAGPMPLDEALEVAVQIAGALDAAPEKGIVHRDLKPGNVMLTAAGEAKVLDFGLARTAEPAAGASATTRRLSPSRQRRPALSSARRPTWRPSRRRGEGSTSGPTSGRSAWCSSRCSARGGPSAATRSPR